VLFVALVAVLLVLATGSSPLSTELAKSEEPSASEAVASPGPASSNSSSGSIKITMTGVVDDEAT